MYAPHDPLPNPKLTTPQDPTDPVSHLCAYLALIPQALVIVYATLLLSTREAEVLLLFAGQLACEAANFLLKRLIKEARPARIPGRGYGMPSSHAQFVAFWSVSVALFLLVRHRANGRSLGLPARAGAALGGFGVAGAVAASRVYLSYHTPRQVLAGLVAGTVCAFAWYGLTAAVRSSGLLERLLVSPFGRLLLLRDLVVEEDPAWAGWERWEGMRRRRTEVADEVDEVRRTEGIREETEALRREAGVLGAGEGVRQRDRRKKK